MENNKSTGTSKWVLLEKNELCDVPCHNLLNIESYFKFKKMTLITIEK